MTESLTNENRKFLEKWPVAGVIRLENEINQYSTKINTKMKKSGEY
jgi:hypothetical protein